MRVVIAEDQVLLREGLGRLFEDGGHQVVASLGDAYGLLPAISEHEPDLVVLGIRMPPTFTDEGARAAKEIKETHPHLGVLVLSQHIETSHAVALVTLGGFGYLLKDRVLEVGEFLAAAERVAQGGSALDPKVVASLLSTRGDHDPLAQLTDRERDVLELMAEGLTNAGIAKRLYLSERTVEAHVRHVLMKLDVPESEDGHRRVLAVLTHLSATQKSPTQAIRRGEWRLTVRPRPRRPLCERGGHRLGSPRAVIPRFDGRSRRFMMWQQGQVFKLKVKGADGQPLWAYRYRLEGRRGSARPQVGGFATRAEAQTALAKVIERLGPAGRAATMTLAELVDEYLELHQAAPVTIAKLRWLLGKATATLGEVRLADLSPKDVYAWRLTIPEGHRFEATQALRQVLNRAITWGLLDYNPAKRGVPNPLRRYKEKRPFESWQQIEAVAERLGPVYGPMIVFAAATGLRPSELFALEQRDIDRALGVVYVRRAYANGRLKHTKTRLSNRAVPLQAIALKALDRLPRSENPILFPNSRGSYIDFRSFGRRHWKPAQTAAGIEPLRHLYDLRHTYATFALRAGVSVFAVSRFMGSSIAMIDYHYGHLTGDSREHAVSLLDALAIERAVDAGWTPPATPAIPLTNRASKPRRTRSRKPVDVRWTPRPKTVASPANKRS